MTDISTETPIEDDFVRPSRLRQWLSHGGLVIGGTILFITIFMAIFAAYLAPGDPYLQGLGDRLQPPIWHDRGSWDHPLGTDQLGRDYLSRLIYGSRISLLIGIGTVAIAGLIGTTLGLVAGFMGGRVDMVISFLITVRLAMPLVLVALAVVGLVGNSLFIVIAVLGLLLWDRFAVVARTAAAQVRNLDYVAAARALGCSTPRIILQEVLPNVMGSILVVVTLEMAHAILLEAALSFLGLGVQPPLPSWGLMIAEGRDFIFFTPWVIAIPGVALFVLVLGINLVGDGLRDVSSPGGRS
ncbi:peptide/nickel transport system permease protein [Primorskyibacter sedentarius]|uniref:Peptide/nickel transport system permease protein n=1 Tax=Primorskyibacter sedentarius TaxID=745311 RepID=A0A4R3IV51_9RHOB|nr:ABC transporter permease [Primorskyibacter sedentarius]TCS55262.1 peptide/nickel transport system permease protein [Primorskyibacter sedentarius]